jgi:hypothetical protein
MEEWFHTFLMFPWYPLDIKAALVLESVWMLWRIEKSLPLLEI